MSRTLSKEDSLFLKGIAVFLLLFHHNPNGLDSLYAFRSGARILVWIFLFVTSYGFSALIGKRSGERATGFIIRRLALIYCPMWIIYFMSLIAHLIVDTQASLEFIRGNVINLPLDILCLSQFVGSGLAGYWYIGFVLMVTVCYPLLYKFVSKTGWFSILITYVFTVIDPIRLYNTEGQYIDMYLLVIVTASVMQQKKVFERLPKIPERWRYPGILITGMLLLCLIFLRSSYMGYVDRIIFLHADPLSTVMTLIIAVSVFYLRRENAASRFVEWIGSQSGNFYYIHVVFYNLVIMRSSIYNRYVSFVLCFIFTLTLSVAIEFVKKKTDYNGRLRKNLDRMLTDRSSS